MGMCNTMCVWVCDTVGIVYIQLSLFPEFNSLSVMYASLSSNFIEQQPPYIRGETPSTRTAGMFIEP